MAISTTYTKRQEQLGKSQTPTTSATPYNGMQGVSQNTANNLGNYQSGYKPSDQAQAAQNMLSQTMAQKPQGYNSKYAPQLDSILQQIQNPKQFKYEFNGDNLFKYYADLYAENGKQASMDAMGQAAALTGGYGNSYAQQVGQQGYNEWLRQIYDKGMDLRDRAYQQHQDELGNQQNIYNILAGQDQADYGKYRDTVGDWQAQLEYDTGRADAERNFDYNQYQADLGYWTDLAGQEAALGEQQRQYDQSLAEQIRNTNLDEAYRRDTLGEQIRQNDLDEAYRRDTLGEQQRQYDTTLAETIRQNNLDEAYRRDQLGEQIRGTNLDEAYRRDQLSQNQAQFDAGNDLDWEKLRQDQAQFDANLTEEQRQYNQKVAMSYVADIIANGQIPSNELLVAAGLSRPDAEKMIKAMTGSGSGSGGNGGNGNGGDTLLYDEKGNPKINMRDANSVYSALQQMVGSTSPTIRTQRQATNELGSTGATTTQRQQSISQLNSNGSSGNTSGSNSSASTKAKDTLKNQKLKNYTK